MKSIFILPTIVVLTSLLYSCANEHHKSHPDTRYLVTSAIQKDTSVVKEYVCLIHSMRHIELRALEKGYIEGIFVDEGQFVKKGQPMFQIMPRLYQAELMKAQAEAHYAEIEYRNTKSLADSDVVAPNELALAAARFDKAKAEMALAQVHLNFTSISAPFEGIMDRLHVREGSLVDEGDILTTLSDNSMMWVYFNVPEPEYLEYQSSLSSERQTEVLLMMANNKLFKYPGVIDVIEADFNSETGNIAFRATFPNPDGLLRHGETGNIQMHIPLKKAILIPQKATFEILDKKYVYVIDENKQVKARLISIGAEMEDLYVVSEGLSASEQFLLEGLRKVKENDQITFTYVEPSEVLDHLKVYVE